MSRVLHTLGFSPEKIIDRRNWLGGSDFTRLMSGDDDKVMNLWREKRGESEPDDLSAVLPVQMGSFTEPLNLDWYELTTGNIVTCEGEERFSPDLNFVRITLDGMVDAKRAILQAKHVNAFAKIDDVVSKYQPQVQMEMHCAGVDLAILSVFIGTMKYDVVEVAADTAYQTDLLMAADHFWAAVKSGEPPVAPKVDAPIITEFRTVDMTGNNEWASIAGDWLDNKDAAKAFDAAVKGIKKLVPDDANSTHGHGIDVARSKSGALTIREMKNAA